MRRLALMQAGGFLYRSSDSSGVRGRPRWVYHPTEKLRVRVALFESDSVAVLNFATLREACKYYVNGECTLKPQPCSISVCPLLRS
jgi:hypothetical protein